MHFDAENPNHLRKPPSQTTSTSANGAMDLQKKERFINHCQNIQGEYANTAPDLFQMSK